MVTKKKVNKNIKSFSDEERAAMKERFEEINTKKEDEERLVLAKINAMPEPDKKMAKKLHNLIMKSIPGITTKTWYGMPAYAKDGQVICFFQNAGKFKARYSTFGFSDKANLDEGNMWPTSFALKKLTAKEEIKIVNLLKKAIS